MRKLALTLMLLAFFATSPVVYSISSLVILLHLFAFVAVLLFLLPKVRQNLMRFGKVVLSVLFLLTITFLMNLLLDSVYLAELYSLELLICLIISYEFFLTFGTERLTVALIGLFQPLKLFKVNISHIETIIRLTLATLPKMRLVAHNIALSYQAKGIKLGVKQAIKYPALMSGSVINVFFTTLADMQLALKIKGIA